MSDMSTLPIFLLLLLAWYASLFGNRTKHKYFFGMSFKFWSQLLLVASSVLIIIGLFHDSTTTLSLSF